jgi:hypothetical protein
MSEHDLQQTLFGYDNGHKLLAASTELGADTERLLLRLTDLSGPRVMEGFQDYYCGYPLPSISSAHYAFARTWYASEMDRPGCVWTHVLILDRKSVEEIGSLECLVQLFRRPRSKRHFEDYKQSLHLGDLHTDRAGVPRATDSEILAAKVVDALYGHDQPTVLVGQTSEDHSGLVFQLWSQQPPALRLRFKFCTGALDALKYLEESFSLQVMPQRVAQLVPDNFTIISKTTFGEELWALKLTEDLWGSEKSELRRFLWRYFEAPAGEQEFQPHAGNVRKLTNIFISLYERLPSGGIPDTLAAVAQEYPKPKSALSLKRALFGRARDLRAAHWDEVEILRMLVSDQNAQALSIGDLEVYDRGAQLWAGNQSGAAKLLVDLLSQRVSKASERLLEGLIHGLSIQDLMQSSETLGLKGLSTVLDRRPELAGQVEFWGLRLPTDWHVEIAEGLMRSSRSQSVLWTILTASREDLLVELINNFPGLAIPAFLDAMSGDNKISNYVSVVSKIGPSLRPYADEVLDWLVRESGLVKSGALIALVFTLRPDQQEVLIKTNAQEWLLALQEPNLGQIGLRLQCFALALGFQNLPDTGYLLVEQTFQAVHTAIANESTGYEYWSTIKPFVPEIAWYQNWDKCERLRQGLAAAYIRHSWPRESFLKCASDALVLRRLLESVSEVSGGDSLLHEILDVGSKLHRDDFRKPIVEQMRRQNF